MFPKPLPEAALAQWQDECRLLPQCKIKTLASTGGEGSSGALKIQTEKSVKLMTQNKMNYRLPYIVINSEDVYLHSRSSPVSYLPHLTPQVSNKAKKNPRRVLTVFTLPAFILLYRDFHFPECKPPRAQISNDYCYKLWTKHQKQRLRTLKSKWEHGDYGGQSPTGWVSWLGVPLLTAVYWRQAPVQSSAAKVAKTPVETLPSLRPGEPEQVRAWGSSPREERAKGGRRGGPSYLCTHQVSDEPQNQTRTGQTQISTAKLWKMN